MQLNTWLIKGRAFHFGRHGLGQEETAISMASDSLFSALLARLALREGYAAVQQFIQPFLSGAPPFVLTSSFPFAGLVRFYPKPLQMGALPANTPDTVPKKLLKKISFVSETCFSKLLAGKSLASLYSSDRLLQGGAVLVDPTDMILLPSHIRNGETPLWSIEQRPRVTIGRPTSKSSIYFTGRVAFAQECGLWFGIRWLVEDHHLQSLVSLLLADLADAGLGAERSVGFGACRIEPATTIDLPSANNTLWVTLSRYLPDKNELHAFSHPLAAYQLIRIGGWMDSPIRRGQRRKSVVMVVEGSVFGPISRPVPGQVVDVKPRYQDNSEPIPHAVYRSGLSVAIGLEGGAL